MTERYPHIDAEVWRTALAMLVDGHKKNELEDRSGMPRNGIVQRLSGRTRTSTDDLLGIASAVGYSHARLMDDLGLIHLPEVEGTTEHRAMFVPERPEDAASPLAKFVARLHGKVFEDAEVLHSFLDIYADVFGPVTDWRVETRRRTGWM